MNMSSLSSKKILLGVSGGIAAYKACDLVRRLRDQGAEVHVVMTQAATQFITPLTLQTLSGHDVHTELFSLDLESKIGHIQLADMPDLILVAPATADLLAKMAQGQCNDLLTTLLCATRKPILLCPSMNVNMWSHPATQANLSILKERGVSILEPAEGALACGYEGTGRLPEVEEIVGEVKVRFELSPLRGRKVLITAGPTWEPLDAVRHISNPSTGKAGYALAEQAAKLGVRVVLVTGPTQLPKPQGVRCLAVKTAQEMADAVFEEFGDSDVVIASAAVSDFRPKKSSPFKAKKEEAELKVELCRNPDILAELGKRKKKGQILVGFAAETHDLQAEALKKLQKKNLDMICANDVSKPGQGFGSDQNEMKLFLKDGKTFELPLSSKHALARCILEQVEIMLSPEGKVLQMNSQSGKKA